MIRAAPLEDNKVCQPHSRPWHVYLDGYNSCSGALINDRWLITSMACSPSTVAILGKHDLFVEEDTEQRIQISDVFVHSPYRSPLHSLTLARLAEPAHFNQYVQPIPLPTRCPKPGETCHVSGWGSTIPNQSGYNGQMKCITVPIVDDQTCMNTFPEYLYWSYYMVCAGQANTDNCLTDGSSVMVCDGQLQGVQWFNHGCRNPADPSVYSKLCLYKDWINNMMDRYVPPLPETTTMKICMQTVCR
uniref:Peptidase S1 domain-containing protein n=1 Tax=Sphaeramia orbicularis TaxID=375764 RepID=A0A672Y6G7_9TELE